MERLQDLVAQTFNRGLILREIRDYIGPQLI